MKQAERGTGVGKARGGGGGGGVAFCKKARLALVILNKQARFVSRSPSEQPRTDYII